ncbi:HAD family hydrolase [Paenibacillus sp. CGMCC 1.16610]|uniref:Phosphoserine phosphatase n=1 Tax=Paenibacillus anseongense TaxID=2682845 RepID=A0ABW9UFW4_9BACL|nr:MULTISPECIES: HAD family hydrolase [Paenibacillus]MBA2944022.1 HAD family hydrolase [Paenibacillus sp. CGMCC 1.16610]MVQ37911.1 HAD-IA family hydrolase [Paenibacillus anseongense]
MKPIKAIIFDLDNTLLWDERSIQEAFEATCEAAAASVNVNPSELEHAVRALSERLFEEMACYDYAKMIEVTHLEALWGRFDAKEHPAFLELGQLAPEYQKSAWTQGLLQLGVNDPELGATLALRFAKERRERPLVYEATFEVLKALRPKYQLLLLTNGAPDLQQEKVDSIPGLADYFDHILISGTFGRGKPDPSIFEHALKLLGVTAEEALMVGDNLDTDIKGALAIGMRNVWINHHQRTAPPHNLPSHEIAALVELLDIVQP